MRCGFYIEAAVYAIASIVYAMVENEPQQFANGSATYLYHVNTDLVMTMRFMTMSSSVILTEDNLSFVRQSWWKLNVIVNELNSSAFFLKSVIYSLFSYSGGIQRIFLQIRKVFKMDQ